MRRPGIPLRAVLPVLILLFSVSSAVAQDRERERRGGQDRGQRGPQGGRFGGPRGGFGRGFGVDKPTLLGSEQVQKELKVGEDQKKKIETVLEEHRGKFRELFGGGGDPAEMGKKREALGAETDKKLAKILRDAQVKRLNEIALQQRGVQALTDAPVVAALKLNDAQTRKVKDILAAGDEERRKLFGGAGGRGPGGRGGAGGRRPGGGPGGAGGRGGQRGGGQGFGEIMEKMQKIQKDTETRALGVLSSEQKEKFTALKGKPFELDRRSLFRGRGGFGGPGRGGPGGGGPGRGGRPDQRRRPPVDDDAI